MILIWLTEQDIGEKISLKYFKKGSFVFKQSETDKEKVHTLVCVDVHKISNSGHY